ncbi:hypothetical protein FRC08_000729 [Ceratobasidium sp. 394]|nr:hypothetical protein FRC08_000729 [Ceratobasidium sp. 394]
MPIIPPLEPDVHEALDVVPKTAAGAGTEALVIFIGLVAFGASLDGASGRRELKHGSKS